MTHIHVQCNTHPDVMASGLSLHRLHALHRGLVGPGRRPLLLLSCVRPGPLLRELRAGSLRLAAPVRHGRLQLVAELLQARGLLRRGGGPVRGGGEDSGLQQQLLQLLAQVCHGQAGTGGYSGSEQRVRAAAVHCSSKPAASGLCPTSAHLRSLR